MSGLRISEALIFCSIRSLYAYLRHALCLGRCLPTTVAVAPQSWVMDIYQSLRGCLCVMPVWCWLVGRGGACLCGCYGAMCVWVDWRLVVHVCGASWRDGTMRVPLARTLLGACVPTAIAALLSRGLWIYQPSGAALCDVCLVLRWGVAVCACVVVVGQCAWVERRWRFMFVERVGAMMLYAYLWHALCLGLVCPRPELSFLSRGLYISPSGAVVVCVSLVVGGDIDWGRLRCSVFLLCYCFYKIS